MSVMPYQMLVHVFDLQYVMLEEHVVGGFIVISIVLSLPPVGRVQLLIVNGR